MFQGFDEFISTDEMTLDASLPTHVKIVDTKQMVQVDLESMEISGDADSATINLREKGAHFTPATFQLFAYVMLHALNGQRKVSTVLRWINELALFSATISQALGGKRITTVVQSMYNFYGIGKSASQIKLLRSALKFWSELDIPGIHPDLAKFLRTSKSPKPRTTNEIQNTTPSERPFTIAQVRALLSNVDTLYMNGDFNPQDNLLWRLIISEAMRPSQMELLRVGDVTLLKDSHERISGANILVPFVKQKTTPARDYMVEYGVSEPVARALHEHLSFLTKLLQKQPCSDSPLFCVDARHKSDRVLVPKMISITQQINRTRRQLTSLSSELANTDLFTRRFKHTKLTHLAIHGASLDVLARAGFQTSMVSLRHYVNLTDEAFAEYERAMAKEHDAIYDALRPAVIPRRQATNPSQENRVLDTDMNEELGSCSEVPCNVFAPFGCYICHRFEAFEDGPHHLVEAELVARRKNSIEMGLPNETVARDDFIIAAVRSVIKLIEVRSK